MCLKCLHENPQKAAERGSWRARLRPVISAFTIAPPDRAPQPFRSWGICSRSKSWCRNGGLARTTAQLHNVNPSFAHFLELFLLLCNILILLQPFVSPSLTLCYPGALMLIFPPSRLSPFSLHFIMIPGNLSSALQLKANMLSG